MNNTNILKAVYPTLDQDIEAILLNTLGDPWPLWLETHSVLLLGECAINDAADEYQQSEFEYFQLDARIDAAADKLDRLIGDRSIKKIKKEIFECATQRDKITARQQDMRDAIKNRIFEAMAVSPDETFELEFEAL